MVESINQWEEARQAEARINKTPYEPKFNAYNPVYMELSKFANLYIGRRSPVARIIRMRSMFGKETELVITRDVAKTSKFSKVYAKGKKA